MQACNNLVWACVNPVTHLMRRQHLNIRNTQQLMFRVLFGVLFLFNIKLNVYIRNTQWLMFGVHFGVLFQERVKIKVNGLCSNIQYFGTPITHMSNCESTKSETQSNFCLEFPSEYYFKKKKKENIGFILQFTVSRSTVVKCFKKRNQLSGERMMLENTFFKPHVYRSTSEHCLERI